eukprot:1137045-Pelagomonas_calceolata.AAC.5
MQALPARGCVCVSVRVCESKEGQGCSTALFTALLFGGADPAIGHDPFGLLAHVPVCSHSSHEHLGHVKNQKGDSAQGELLWANTLDHTQLLRSVSHYAPASSMLPFGLKSCSLELDLIWAALKSPEVLKSPEDLKSPEVL